MQFAKFMRSILIASSLRRLLSALLLIEIATLLAKGDIMRLNDRNCPILLGIISHHFPRVTGTFSMNLNKILTTPLLE
jgi:hypothetical protein